MADPLRRIEDKLDVLVVQTTRNTASLEEHIRRTELLEARLEPVETYLVQARFILPSLVGIGAVVGLVLGALELWHRIAG